MADGQINQNKQLFDQSMREQEAEHKIKTEVGPKVEQALGAVMQEGFGQLSEILTQILQVSQQTLIAQEKPRQVSMSGINIQRDSTGSITGVGANVKPTMQ